MLEGTVVTTAPFFFFTKSLSLKVSTRLSLFRFLKPFRELFWKSQHESITKDTSTPQVKSGRLVVQF
jgi:hypothetical protein